MSDRQKKYADGAERLAKTFFQAFAAALIYKGTDDVVGALKFAALAGLLSVCTSIAGWGFGNKATSSALPAAMDPATPPGQGPE